MLPPRPANPFAALASAPSPVSQSSAGPVTVDAFLNLTTTAPGQHGVLFEKPRTAAPVQRSATTPTMQTSPVQRPPTTAPQGDILDYVRTHKACFAHALTGNCRSPGNCQWQNESFPAARYKYISTRRPESSTPRCRLASMTEVQHNTAAELGLILVGSGDDTEPAGFDCSNDQQE